MGTRHTTSKKEETLGRLTGNVRTLHAVSINPFNKQMNGQFCKSWAAIRKCMRFEPLRELTREEDGISILKETVDHNIKKIVL